MTEMIIRQLHSNDAEDFRTIRLSALKKSPEMFGSNYAIESKQPLEIFRERITKSVIFAAYFQNRIIGVLILHIENDVKNKPQAYLYSFFVEPKYRNQGIAGKLLQTVIQHGQQYTKQLMLSVVSHNIPAIQLYKKYGFKIITQTRKNNEYEIEMIFFY